MDTQRMPIQVELITPPLDISVLLSASIAGFFTLLAVLISSYISARASRQNTLAILRDSQLRHVERYLTSVEVSLWEFSEASNQDIVNAETSDIKRIQNLKDKLLLSLKTANVGVELGGVEDMPIDRTKYKQWRESIILEAYKAIENLKEKEEEIINAKQDAL